MKYFEFSGCNVKKKGLWFMKKVGTGRENPTWRQILGIATGVHQDVGLKRGVEVIICTEGGQGRKCHHLLMCRCVCV